MESTKIVNWTLGNGKTAECTVEAHRYMDLNDINVPFGGKHPVEILEVTIMVDGKGTAWSLTEPTILSPGHKLIAAGGYAKVGDNGVVAKVTYEAIMAAIAEATAEAETDPEWAAHKIQYDKVVAQNTKDLAEYYKAQDNSGICPHCGGYCEGDCQAN